MIHTFFLSKLIQVVCKKTKTVIDGYFFDWTKLCLDSKFHNYHHVKAQRAIPLLMGMDDA